MADDMDLFGGELTAEEKAAEEQRKAEKAKKVKEEPKGRSQIVFEVKPWGEDTDMAAMEAAIRGIQKEGLMWGAARLEPVVHTIKMLVIMMNVDDEVNTQEVQDEIEELEDYVQSVDIRSFTKL
ncbi:elongation factor 1-beta, putative [Entamoeba invadens IP1]|uniref:Elongation factor 1-beta, putative n=1 Tax=Entamoeba invadens IP1 TaxID=370355 RepID=A0A0A1U1L7_ENTIV|nr:elongation factor 1-beta, putative [Entamoeba invadens IP1]ELP86498.1 elongation factor 1-beta, putative [Entamoeba invadens IP1]|eukprot:XP_004185844.1 elongation factor 1-beta, putative [Entamoeba invadens IP1]